MDSEQKERLDRIRRNRGVSLQQFLEELLDRGLRSMEWERNRSDIDWDQLASDEEELADLVVRTYRKNQRNDLEEAAIRILQGLRNLAEREKDPGKRKPAATRKSMRERS